MSELHTCEIHGHRGYLPCTLCKFEQPRGTAGPDFDPELDAERISDQHRRIRQFMLEQDRWYTLAEIEEKLGYPQASISAQLRHLRKIRFGAFDVQKRRRVLDQGTWEYRVRP